MERSLSTYVKSENDMRGSNVPFIYTSGKKWFFRLKGENGLVDYLSDEDKIFHLIISFINIEGRRFYSSFESHTDFLQYMLKLPMEKRCFHEVVIEKRIQKMRFDIDIKRYKYFEEKIISEISEEEVQIFFDELISSTIEEFENLGLRLDPKEHILVFSSHGKEKWSFHIIIDGFYCESSQDAFELFKRITSKMSKEYLEWLDGSIYSANHCLRTLGSVKQGQDEYRMKILEKRWRFKDQDIFFEYPETPKHDNHRLALDFERSFLTLVSNCYPIPCLSQSQVLDSVMKKEKQAESEILDYAFRLFQSMYGKVCSYFGSMGNMIMLSRNYPSGCPICERVHDKDNAFLYVKSVESENNVLLKYDIYFYCRRSSGKKIKIGEKMIVDEKHISKDRVILEKKSKRGFNLSDIEYVSKTCVSKFK